MNPEPVLRPTRIADTRVSPPVLIPAALIRNFPHTQLAAVEAAWAPARRVLAGSLRRAGITLESGHWDWSNKITRVERGELVLHAIECEGEVQGLMATKSLPRPALLAPGQAVVYIDYLEAAPWNQRAPDHPACFGGVGSALFTEAVILSTELGLGGRIGLHSLPQAEDFYAKCEMARLGRDADYHDLVYFEYDDVRAARWLATRNTG